MKTRAILAIFLLLALPACGPLIGSMTVAGNGVKQLTVATDQNGHLLPGSSVAVLGPFSKTPEAFYICRGEEAALFAAQFNESGLFSAELAMATRFPEDVPTLDNYLDKSAEKVQSELGLKTAPHYLMTGTIMKREMVVAPAQGVVMKVAYRLEFLDLVDGQRSRVDVDLQSMFQDAVPSAVRALSERLEHQH